MQHALGLANLIVGSLYIEQLREAPQLKAISPRDRLTWDPAFSSSKSLVISESLIHLYNVLMNSIFIEI